MNDKDSKLIYEGWRGMISKKWDQNHGARERGFADHEAEQQHLGDEAAAKEHGLDVEKYLRAKEQAEEQGKTIEEIHAVTKYDKWFLYQIKTIIDQLNHATLQLPKQLYFCY